MADNKILNNDVLEVKGVIAHGELRIGTHAVHDGYTGLWNTEASTTTTGQYLIISAGTDTYVNGDNVYIRAGNNSTSNQVKITTSGTTIGGNTVWHAGNDGTGSGLDADTVDGLEASSFLRSDANDTTSGTITLSGTDWYLLGLGARGASSGAYGIGNRNDDTYRQLTFHVPNQAAYSSTGTIPSFGWYSNGSDELMKLESASGNLWLKGELDVDTITIGAGVTLTESTDRSDLLMIKSSTSSWGGLQVSNTSNEVIFSLMGNDNTLGLYDDLNDDWILQRTENGATSLYHNAGAKLSTTSTGISVTGGIVASELVEANSGLKVDNVITHTTDALAGHNSANTTTNRYKFMELAYNSYHWIGSSPIIIEVFQRDFQGAEYAKYILQNGSMDSGGSQDGSGNGVDDFRLILKESNCVDGNSNNHRIFVGDPEDTGLDQSSYDIYKIPIYLDAWYYSDYSVKITMASSSLTRVTSFTSATQYIFNESPTATTYSGTPTALPSAPNAVYGKLYGDAYIHNLSSTDSLDTTYYLDPAGNSNLSGNLTVGGKLTVSTVDATSTAVTALLLGAGNEVKKRGLGSNAFNSTTIPTNNNQLTNGAGYITGVGWSDLSGDQSEIPVSGFNNDAGYLTAHPSITEAADVNNSGGTVIQDLTFDDNGHVTATGSVNLDNIYTSTDGSENDFRFGLNLGNFTGTRWYRVGTVNTGSGGMRIRGMLTNHVESFGSCMIDLAIQGREGNNNNEIEITGHVHSLNQNSGIAVYQSDTSSGSYRNWDVYVVATKYTQCELDLTKVSCSFDTSGSNVTTEPSGTKELDTSSLTEGNYVIVNSVAKEIYHEGHKPTYSELGTMAYTNLTGTPTIPTNNNQLTNGAGYVTGVAWNELSGDQSEIQISGFNNDSGYLTAHPSISAATSVDNSGRTYIQDITLDSNGHVTAITSATETVVNTNTTYSAGSGLDLTSTTFSVEPDLRDGITHIGKDANNYITFDSTNGRIDFYAGGVFVARMESDGDLHVKGDVIAFSSIFA